MAYNDLGNTYIEVDLTEQYMWYYQDGNVIFESDIVSGTSQVIRREKRLLEFSPCITRRARMCSVVPRKPDGTYSYEQPVTYWMPFNGGIGFHDADLAAILWW